MHLERTVVRIGVFELEIRSDCVVSPIDGPLVVAAGRGIERDVPVSIGNLVRGKEAGFEQLAREHREETGISNLSPLPKDKPRTCPRYIFHYA